MGDSVFFTIVQVAGILAACALFASPSPDLLRIHRTKTIGEVSVVPLVSLFGSAYLWCIYGLFTDAVFPVFITNALGLLAATVYTIVYYLHTTERRYVGRLVAGLSAALACVTIYAVLGATGTIGQTLAQTGEIFGYLAVSANIVLFASPFETVVAIVRTKSASSLPIALCFVAMINCSIWVLYAIIDSDMFVLTPNVLGLVFSIIQVGLYVKYKPAKRSDCQQVEDALSIVVVHGGDNDSGDAMSPKASHSSASAFALLKSPTIESVVSTPLTPVQTVSV